MFWKKEKKVKVEFTTPLTITYPDCGAPPVTTETPPKIRETDKDFALKLLICLALFIQTSIYIYGHIELTAYYEQFGIMIGELELTNSTILLIGYSQILTSILSWPDLVPYFGYLLPWIPFVITAIIYFFLLVKNETTWIAITLKGISGGYILYLLFFAPLIGMNHGIERGTQAIISNMGINAKNKVTKEYTIITNDNIKISGQLLAIDAKSTFLISDHTVYKFDSKTGRVLRETLLKEKQPKQLINSK
ncbi:hypothetical protein [Pseudomonas protegens]|uniref:hypothetical protein n=1 Tax=Pseudomonas protegens TaxID=380021 RepID=UPI000E1F0D37|nr:hypothetical protein [Pseudomonas protegens]AXK52370.1 hypothetical protein DWF74_03010 [Pseudomonas protegens]